MKNSMLDEKIVEDLSSYFKAFYPLIYILSHEEDRIEFYLQHICHQRDLKLFTWDSIDGFYKLLDNSNAQKIENSDMDYGDYYNSLSFIEKEGNENSLFLLKDFHPAFLLNESDQIIRKIRNVIVNIRMQSKIMVMLMPPGSEKKAVPSEMEKDLVLYDFPLPGHEEGKELFNQVVHESLDNQIPVKLDQNEEQMLIKACMGLTSNEMHNAFIRSGLRKNRFDSDCIQLVLEEKKQIVEKSGILEYYSTDINATEVGGLENLKSWLADNHKMFSQAAIDQGCDTPKGILLVGVPGCGKSLTAKTLASQWKMPLLRLDLSAVFGGLVGESEQNMRKVLNTAESVAPCVLWVDEIEKGLSGMTSTSSGDSGTSQRVFGSLISWMQDKEAPVFFVATANDISRIADSSPELLRSGRFDEIFFIDLPNQKEREEIFSIHLLKRNEQPGQLNTQKLGELTSGFSGSDIEQAVKDAKRNCFVNNNNITQEALEEAINFRLPVAVTMKHKIEELRKWAAAHAKFASVKKNEESIGSVDDFVKKRHSIRKITSMD